jgi:uncharacterized iron-regulated membrane protein
MRRLFFWTHLILGTAAAVVILIMSVTGVLLMYERQMIQWADRGYRSTQTGARLTPETLVNRIGAQTGSIPDSLTLRSDPEAPAEASHGPRVVYADVYSGRVLGEGSSRVRRFFRVVTDWHRWLALEGSSRQLGRAVTGAANLAFLGLALSGIYLWLPRKWTWSSVRAVLWFRGDLSGKARDFNWHNAAGIWCAIPLVAVIAGAAVISYPWATELVYRIAGSAPPSTSRPPGAPAGRSGQPDLVGLDRAWQQAALRVPAWQTITWRPSPGNRISLAVAESHRGRVDLRSTVVVDRSTGQLVSHEAFSGYDRGRRWRMWLRFIHTGEALGVAGQTIAGLASAGGALLVWTGLALAIRRFLTWRSRRISQKQETHAPAAV